MLAKDIIIMSESENDANDHSNSNECTICMQTVNEEEVVTLPCGHRFHGACLAPWLWENRSCPNCRHAPNEDDNTESLSLNRIIDAIRESRRTRSQHLQRGLRRSNATNACSAQRRNARLYRKWKQKMVETRKLLHVVSRRDRDERKQLRNTQNLLYKEYILQYNKNNKDFKERNRPNQLEISRINRNISRQQRTVRWYEDLLISDGNEP